MIMFCLEVGGVYIYSRWRAMTRRFFRVSGCII